MRNPKHLPIDIVLSLWFLGVNAQVYFSIVQISYSIHFCVCFLFFFLARFLLMGMLVSMYILPTVAMVIKFDTFS